MGPNGPNNKHSSAEHLWHVARSTSLVASLRVARQGRQSQIFPHKPGSPWGKLVATYNFASSSFWHHMISSQDHFYPASWWLSILTQLTFAGENGPRWVELDRCANGAARLVGIPSNLSLNFNIPMKHGQIGGHSLRFAIEAGCRLA